MLNMLKPALAACMVLAACCVPSHAQVTEEDIALLNEIMAVDTSPENAREAHKQCRALQQKLAAREGMDPIQRIYHEAEIDACLAYALNNGKFTDEGGDACSYHMSFARKLEQVIRQGVGRPGFQGAIMQVVGDRLRSAMNIGSSLGCKGDYDVFQPAVAMAEEESRKPTPEPDLELLNEVGAAQSNLSESNAREVQKACDAVRPKIAQKPGRPEAESAYIEANVENCISLAKQIGKYEDAAGTSCDHAFRQANLLAKAYAASQKETLYAGFADVFRGEIENLSYSVEGMGCPQDFRSLIPK